MALIAANNVSKDYQTEDVTAHALQGLDFEIEPASFVSMEKSKTTIALSCGQAITFNPKPALSPLWEIIK
jgi:hypothetical protein